MAVNAKSSEKTPPISLCLSFLVLHHPSLHLLKSGKTLDNGTKVALEVQVGQKVIFSKYAGTEVKLDGEELMILNERDILAIVE